MILLKKILISLFFLSSITAHGQWILQYQTSNPTSVIWYDIKFINRNTGWVCGIRTIMKTTNGGNNWVQQLTPAPNKEFYKIFPIDSNLVYCVGTSETILKTTNGGNNWIAIRNGPMYQGQSYLSLFFTSKDTGWIAGEQYIYRTSDGCATFDSTYLNYWLYDLYFINSNTGLGVGAGGHVFKTTNSGTNWNEINIIPKPMGWIYNLSVINNKYCYFIEEERSLYRSLDFGDTWDSICSVPYFEQIQPNCCYFSSINTGWVGGPGRLLKSTDGGYTWKREYLPYSIQVLAMYFQNDYTGWITGGGYSRIFHTTTGGEPLLNVTNTGNEIPVSYSLEQNYPNPFNQLSIIQFQVPSLSFPNTSIGGYPLGHPFVSIVVYDLLGREVRTLINEYKQPGTYQVSFNAEGLSSGIYFYRMTAGVFSDVKRMVLVK